MLQATHHRVAGLFRALGSLLPRKPGSPDRLNRIVRPWRHDSERTYPTVGLKPSRLLSYLQAADAGSPQMQFELFGEMLQKWPRLAAVENTRRLALTGLDWEIMPAPGGTTDGGRSGVAQAVADHCRETFLSLDRFRDVLSHLASAIAYGVALAELVWESSRLVDVVPVPYARLCSDPHEPWRRLARTLI